MTFLIVTSVQHILQNGAYFAYAPYVREMNIWLKHVDKVIIVAPINNQKVSPIHLQYQHKSLQFLPIDEFNIKTLKETIKTVFKIPKIAFKLFFAMKKANHIHLRCPGNVGLIGLLIQILFPSKTKTAKYAGNWDPKAKANLSYRLQKYLLSTTFLTKNMNVLVYGQWENQTNNIKPFFTASYLESDKEVLQKKELSEKIKIIFVGTLSVGKRPLYAIQVIEQLLKRNHEIEFSIYGEGSERNLLEKYISKNSLAKNIFLKGNQTAENIKKAYQESHFMLLPSESEGWPKVVAEAMFWGCVPIATSVSCVPYMLDFGQRGLFLDIDLHNDTNTISGLFQSEKRFQEMMKNGVEWSRKYTLDYFEQDIKLLLQS